MAAMRRLLVGITSCCVALAGAVGPALTAAASSAAGANRGDLVYSTGDLYLVHHADGTTARLTWSGDANDPSWSPDGRTIAYDHAGDIWLVTPGAGKHQLTHNGQAADPTWSPDGRTIAYSRSFSSGHRIYLVPAAGGTSRPLGHALAGCDATQPDWAADWQLGYTCASEGIAVQWPKSAPRLIIRDIYAGQPAFLAGGTHLVYVTLCAPGQCQEVAVWESSATGAGRHQVDSPIAQRWTCEEGDICLVAVVGSPYGWAESGTYSDVGAGGTTTFTCYLGAVDEGADGVVLAPPDLCVNGIATDFAVRPA